MDEDYIFKLAAPYAKHGLMTYEDFENVFEDFERREQYEICEILYESGIELVDEVPQEIFVEEIKPSVYEESPLPVKKSVAMSNETLVNLIQDATDYETRMQALQDLCQKNIKFVYNFAKKYENFLGNYLELEELVQEGFIGMLRAVETFDRRKGYKFLTYAGYYIKAYLRRAIMDIGFRVRVPVHMQESIAKVIELDIKFYMEGDEDFQSRVKRIVDEMDLSENSVLEIFKIRDMFLIQISLDMPIGEDGDTTLGEFIPYEAPESIEDKVLKTTLAEELNEVLDTLTEREKEVLELRFGLHDGRLRTLEEIGKKFKLTRERIRQIEGKALRKLRHPSRSKKLKEFLN